MAATDGLAEILKQIADEAPTRVVCSAPRTGAYRRAAATPLKGGWQIERLTEKQAFHQNIPQGALADNLALLMEEFSQLTAFTPSRQHSLRITKKGKLLHSSRPLQPAAATPGHAPAHNRQKATLLPPGVFIPPLADMGVIAQDGHVIAAMQDKYRQINRFLELVEDALKQKNPAALNIVDFGCGKSYLTFILYYYLTQVRGIDAHITGLDLKQDVIEHCNAAARRYGYGGLRFVAGDIAGFTAAAPVDMVVTLHACDTATDHALANAVKWDVDMIFSVPCCQHELNAQMRSEALSILTRYGIVKERTAALMTDALRANLLYACGYKTQLVEFVGFEHTPKNIMIRGVKAALPATAKEKALAEAKALMDAFCFDPTLYRLLQQQGRLK